MNRRNAIIKALAAVMAAFGGRRVEAQEIPYIGEPPAEYRTYSSSQSTFIEPKKTGMTFNLDYSTGITLSLHGESIHLSPEEIMEALRS